VIIVDKTLILLSV